MSIEVVEQETLKKDLATNIKSGDGREVRRACAKYTDKIHGLPISLTLQGK